MSDIAVIQTGGKQYLVKPGQTLRVEKLTTDGKNVEFKDLLQAKTVKTAIVGAGKGKKVRILKFKPKTRYTRRKGHRQPYTEIKIESII